MHEMLAKEQSQARLHSPAPASPAPPGSSPVSYWPRLSRGPVAFRPRPGRSPRPSRGRCRAPQAPPPPSLLGAAGPGVWRCRSRARPGSAATATAIAGSSSPSTGEGRGHRGARGPASSRLTTTAPAEAPGLARHAWGRPGHCPTAGRPEDVRPSPSRRGGGPPESGEVPAEEARHHLGLLGARGDGRRG